MSVPDKSDLLETSCLDLLDFLDISNRQDNDVDVNRLPSKVNFIIGELCKQLMSRYENEGTELLCADIVAFKSVLNRLHIMLKIHLNPSCERHGEGYVSPDWGEILVNNCLHVLHHFHYKIKEDTCVPVLCDILKLSLLHLEQINPSIFWRTISKITTNCKSALLIHSLESSMLEDNFAMSKELMCPGILKTTINLKVLETVVDVLSNSKNSLNEDYVTNIQNLLNDESLLSLILEIIIHANKHVTSLILLGIVPKIVKCTTSNLLLMKIWTHFSTGNDIVKVFLVLCTLADYFIPDGSNSQLLLTSLTLVSKSKFWKLLRFGLVHDDALIRKQALYISKRASDIISSSCASIHTEDNVCVWDPHYVTELKKKWERCFLILETLEEKQIHLINPVLPLVEKFINTSSVCSLFHSQWVLCILQRMLKHDNGSIVKWGVLNLLTLDLLYFQSGDFTPVLKLLLITLNNAFLFMKDVNEMVSEVGVKLTVFLTRLTSLPPEPRLAVFSDIILNLTVISWDPVPLLYVLHALAAIPPTPLWSEETLLVVRSFIIDALGTHSVFIRGGIQCQLLKAVTRLADVRNLHLQVAADVLGSFHREESLKRGTHSWSSVVIWLQTFIDPVTAQNHIAQSLSSISQSDVHAANSKSIDLRSIARIILLLSDAELLQFESSDGNVNSALEVMQQALNCFENAESRLYSCEDQQDAVLELIIHILQEFQSHNNAAIALPSTQALLLLIRHSVPDIFHYVRRRIMLITHLRELHTLNLYFDALESFANSKFYAEIVESIEMFQTMAMKMHNTLCEPNVILTEGQISANLRVSNSPLHQYSAIRIMVWVASRIKEGFIEHDIIKKNQNNFVQEMIQSKALNRVIVKNEMSCELTRDLNMLWGRLVGSYLQGTWAIVALYLENQRDMSSIEDISNLCEDALECLEIGGRNVLVDIMKVFEQILSNISNELNLELIAKFVTTCWKATFELRKIELFWVAFRQFIKMIYQKQVIGAPWFQQYLPQFAREIFEHGQAIMGLANILMNRLLEEVSVEHLPLFSECLIEALLFGPMHRRNQKFEEDAVAFIQQLGTDCSVNELVSVEHQLDNKVRALGVTLMHQVINSSNCHQIAADLIERLLLRDKDIRNTRYFNNSYVHRFKHRVMQVLLIIEPALTSNDGHSLISWLSTSLLTENHQPSVRYQQEWLLARVLLRMEEARPTFWSVFRSAADVRPGSMSSFVAVAYLVAVALHSPEQEAFINKAMAMILPWCMAQHFNVRIYAQVTMQKLWEISKSKNYSSILNNYGLIISSLQISIDHGNAFKNAQKLQEDFYLNTFNPVEHFSLATIYYELPRLANLSHSELISTDVFIACGLTDSESIVPLRNNDDRLKECTVGSWALKSSGSAEQETGEDAECTNFQKKIIPWTAMIPDQNVLLGADYLLNTKKRATNNGLIVLSSLIDRPPNLGGLCRTCEVFGVSEFILGNLKYVEDKQFQSLSVSAERWIRISEVKPHLLSKFLPAMKLKGYTVVGAEQTSNSVQINVLKFPKKTLLLLGNEREGIPADLLPLLDVCVAVPQQGLVRSLNVHVTGAIFIWEYSKQHHL